MACEGLVAVGAGVCDHNGTAVVGTPWRLPFPSRAQNWQGQPL